MGRGKSGIRAQRGTVMADATSHRDGPFAGLRQWLRQWRKGDSGEGDLRHELEELIEEHQQEERRRRNGSPGAGRGFQESHAAAGDDPSRPRVGGPGKGGDPVGELLIGMVSQARLS